MPIAIIILLLVLTAIALRNTVHISISIWAIMTVGAAFVLLLGQITLPHAIAAIDFDIMLYLLGVFIISQAAETSGYLEQLTDRLFAHANTGKQALLIIVFILGLSTAILMNDTIAIVGTPIVLQLCKSHKQLVKPLLLALAYSITIGSVVSPIGNPQNLLIAVKGGMTSPFIDFMKVLAIPTVLNLLVVYLLIFWVYRKQLSETIEKPTPVIVCDQRTVLLVKISLALMLMLITAKVITEFTHASFHIRFGFIALISALPIILFSRKRWSVMKGLDWGTLLFFISTFVLMQSVWDSGFFQNYIQQSHIVITHTPTIMAISIFLSQFISNVPLVTLYLPLLNHNMASQAHLLALAVGSTIAGNLTLLGAASNIIIAHSVEKRKIKGFSFYDFMKLGLPLTIINVVIYAFFL